MDVCCHFPGRSMNLRSTITAPFFLPKSIASFGFIFAPLTAGRSPALNLSDRFLSTLAGANPHRFVDRQDENLAVADATGLRALLDRVDHFFDERVRHDDLELHLRHEVDDVGRAAIDLFFAAGTAE